MDNRSTIKIQIQQAKEWISWQKEINRISRVEIRSRETKIRRLEKKLKYLSTKIKK